jgi:hypothetical protein
LPARPWNISGEDRGEAYAKASDSILTRRILQKVPDYRGGYMGMGGEGAGENDDALHQQWRELTSDLPQQDSPPRGGGLQPLARQQVKRVTPAQFDSDRLLHPWQRDMKKMQEKLKTDGVSSLPAEERRKIMKKELAGPGPDSLRHSQSVSHLHGSVQLEPIQQGRSGGVGGGGGGSGRGVQEKSNRKGKKDLPPSSTKGGTLLPALDPVRSKSVGAIPLASQQPYRQSQGSAVVGFPDEEDSLSEDGKRYVGGSRGSPGKRNGSQHGALADGGGISSAFGSPLKNGSNKSSAISRVENSLVDGMGSPLRGASSKQPSVQVDSDDDDDYRYDIDKYRDRAVGQKPPVHPAGGGGGGGGGRGGSRALEDDGDDGDDDDDDEEEAIGWSPFAINASK